MTAIMIQADNKSNKLLSELAKQLGGKVLLLNDKQYEDFVLGSIMNKVKTGEIVSRAEIMRKLKNK